MIFQGKWITIHKENAALFIWYIELQESKDEFFRDWEMYPIANTRQLKMSTNIMRDSFQMILL